MAPKKKEKNLKRSNIITLKLTDIELAVLNEAADVTGLSRSEYVRKLLLEKQINHQIEVVADMNDLRKLVSEYYCTPNLLPYSYKDISALFIFYF